MPSLIDRIRTALATPSVPRLRGDDGLTPDVPEAPKIHVPAAVLMPIIPVKRPKLLLTTRTSHLRKHAGQVAFPGGRIDDTDKGPISAALREAQEEVGLNPRSVKVLGMSDDYQTGTGYRVQPVVGTIPIKPKLLINPDEVANIFEVPLDFALDPANHQLREGIWNGEKRRYYVIEWEGHTIWGATAGMLVNLAGRLK